MKQALGSKVSTEETKINKFPYLNILKHNVIEKTEKLCLKVNITFYETNKQKKKKKIYEFVCYGKTYAMAKYLNWLVEFTKLVLIKQAY